MGPHSGLSYDGPQPPRFYTLAFDAAPGCTCKRQHAAASHTCARCGRYQVGNRPQQRNICTSQCKYVSARQAHFHAFLDSHIVFLFPSGMSITQPDYTSNNSAVVVRPHLPLKRDEVRILVLYPGHFDDVLQAHLQPASLSSTGDYEAISYVWGKSTQEREIHLNSVPFGITSSLHSALWAFRHTTEARRLWADAICINQEDLLERNEQVDKMGRVYSQAKSVLIWLGEGSLPGATALWMTGILHDASKLPEMQRDTFRRFLNPGLVVRETLDAYFARRADLFLYKFSCPCCSDCVWAHPPSLQGAMDAMSELWGNRWFYRLWVLQEASLGQQCLFYYGQYCASFEQVSSASDMWDALYLPPETTDLVAATPLWTHSHISGMIKTIHHWRNSSYHSSLQHFLDTFDFARTSLACSKIQDFVWTQGIAIPRSAAKS